MNSEMMLPITRGPSLMSQQASRDDLSTSSSLHSERNGGRRKQHQAKVSMTRLILVLAGLQSIFMAGCIGYIQIFHPVDVGLLGLSLSLWSKQAAVTKGQACRYDGQCPTGMTCGIPTRPLFYSGKKKALSALSMPQETIKDEDDMPGECQEFPLVQDFVDPPEACVEACQAELEMDEHFFHETWPLVTARRATSSLSRPAGCSLDFTVQYSDNVEHWRQLHSRDGEGNLRSLAHPAPSIVTWEKTRFRHIVRVDPVLPTIINSNNETIVQWRAYCTAPCKTHDDCQTRMSRGTSSQPWQCIKGACQRNPNFWELDLSISNNKKNEAKSENTAPNHHTPELVLVTGANIAFFGALKNLVASARYWAPHHRVVVYNLGGLAQVPEVKAEILSWKNVIALEWPEGIPQHYPEHVRTGSNYAWKPLIIQETLLKYKQVFWLDAGSTLTGPIRPVEEILKRNGIFLVHGQDTDMKPLAHPDTFKWFGFDKETMRAGPHFGGGTQAHMYPSRFVDSIVNRNAACAMDKLCIQPERSETYNHRYDQTSLSIAAYHPTVRAPHHTEYLSCEMRNHPTLALPSYRFIYTARGLCRNCYISETQSYLEKGISPVDWVWEDEAAEIANVTAGSSSTR